MEEIDAAELAGDDPAMEYVPPHAGDSMDILTRIGQAFRYEDLVAGSEFVCTRRPAGSGRNAAHALPNEEGHRQAAEMPAVPAASSAPPRQPGHRLRPDGAGVRASSLAFHAWCQGVPIDGGGETPPGLVGARRVRRRIPTPAGRATSPRVTEPPPRSAGRLYFTVYPRPSRQAPAAFLNVSIACWFAWVACWAPAWAACASADSRPPPAHSAGDRADGGTLARVSGDRADGDSRDGALGRAVDRRALRLLGGLLLRGLRRGVGVHGPGARGQAGVGLGPGGAGRLVGLLLVGGLALRRVDEEAQLREGGLGGGRRRRRDGLRGEWAGVRAMTSAAAFLMVLLSLDGVADYLAMDWWKWTARHSPFLRTKTRVAPRPTGSDVNPALSVYVPSPTARHEGDVGRERRIRLERISVCCFSSIE